MKKIITVALFSLGYVFANAQFEAGRFQVVGSSEISFSGERAVNRYDGKKKGDPIKSRSFEFSPKAGYFIDANMLVGGALSIRSEREKSSLEEKTRGTFFGPFFRYYLPQGKIAPFAQVGLGFVFLKHESEIEILSTTTKIEANYRGVGFFLGGGIMYLVSSNVGVEASLAYDFNTIKDKDDKKSRVNTSKVGMNIGVSLLF